MKKIGYVSLCAAMMLAMGMLASCDKDDAKGDYTEVWTVNIEPEFVLSGDFWGGFTPVYPAMKAIDDEGNHIGTFTMGQIKGFDFEEGYRYKLEIQAKDIVKAALEEDGVYFVDAPRYEFSLLKVLSKEYVGIRQEGRRDLEMDVQFVRVRSTNEIDSWEYRLLLGTVVGTDETILMHSFEIAGLDEYWIFQEFLDNGTVNDYRVRMKVSITPSDEIIYGNLKRRIRLQEIVNKERIDKDSIIYMDREEIEQFLYGV